MYGSLWPRVNRGVRNFVSMSVSHQDLTGRGFGLDANLMIIVQTPLDSALGVALVDAVCCLLGNLVETVPYEVLHVAELKLHRVRHADDPVQTLWHEFLLDLFINDSTEALDSGLGSLGVTQRWSAYNMGTEAAQDATILAYVSRIGRE